MNSFKKSFFGALLAFLFFVGLGIFTPLHSVKAISITVPSDYSNCGPVTVTFETDSLSYMSGDSIEISGTAQQNSGDDCYVNTMKLGGALNYTNASQNFLTSPYVLNPSGSPVSNYLSGGPVFFTQAQNDGTQYAYFRFSMCELCQVGGNCGSYNTNNSTAVGQCSYVVGSSAYCVGSSCEPNGNNGSNVTVQATPNPPTVDSGNTSTIIYSSTDATSCRIYKNNVKVAEFCPTSGSYQTGPLTASISYQIECGTGLNYIGSATPTCNGGGATAMNSLPFAKTNIFDKIKNFISNLIPKAIADQISSAMATVNITVTTPQPVVTLNFDSSKLKDLVKKGVPDPIGTSYFIAEIRNLPVTNICELYKNGVNISGQNSNYKLVGNFTNKPLFVSGISDSDNFQLHCTGGILSSLIAGQPPALVNVKGQSGTLSSSATSGGVTSCVIPANGSSCSIPTTWGTSNPKTGINTYFNGATAPAANSGTNVSTTIASVSGSMVPRTVLISTNNKVDGEYNTAGNSVLTENQLVVLAVSVKCADGSNWNGTKCDPLAIPSISVNLEADPLTMAAPGQTNLFWTTSGGPTSCVGSDAWNGAKAVAGGSEIKSGLAKGDYTYTITCSKAGFSNVEKSVTVSVTDATNLSPLVYAGSDIVTSGNQVTISTATASDPDGPAPLIFEWTVSSKPIGSTISLLNTNTLTPTFSFLTVAGTYVFQLRGTESGASPKNSIDTMTVTVVASGSSLPVVTVAPETNKSVQSATLNGGVTSQGSSSLTGKGFCLGKTALPSTGCVSKTPISLGSFDQDRSGLDPNTKYYYRTYASNSSGTAYSADRIFTTDPVTVSVVADTPYTVDPDTIMTFTYVPSTNTSPNTTACRLLDYLKNTSAPLTGYKASSPTHEYKIPSDVGVYGYYVQCRNNAYPAITGFSNEIIVNVEKTIPLAPDLVITDTWPINVYTGATTFFATVLNAGTAGTGKQFNNKFQVSTTDNGSNVIGNYTTDIMEALDVGVSKMTEKSINFPTAGTFYMRACADLPPVAPGTIDNELDEGNNCGPWVEVNVSDGQPDLVASVPTPTEITTGNSTFYSNITNQGNGGTVSNFTNRFQVSTTANGSNIIGTYTDEMAALGPYITGGTSAVINFPTAGTFYMQACADLPPNSPGKVTNESDENNNCSGFVPITVYTSYPDLVISNTYPSDPADVWVGNTTFFASVTNQGEAGTGGQFKNRFQVSTLPNGGGTISNYDTGLIGPLGPYITGGTSAVINFPTVGTYYMRACADIPPNNPGVIPESDETNNCSADWLPVTVQPIAAGVDLTASTTYPTYVPTGATTFYSNITNGGVSGTILQFTNRFQVSTTSDGSNIIGTYDTAPIGPLGSLITGGTSKSINFSTLGTYYMRACADIPPNNPGTIGESNEENNCSGWEPVYVEACANGATDYPICTDIIVGGTDGSCSAVHNGCAAGTSVDIPDSADSYLWRCEGISGGADIVCSELKNNGGGGGGAGGAITFTAIPSWIFKGRSSTLNWSSSADPGTCVGEGFDTGGQSSGSFGIKPDKTTTYTLSGCTEAGVDLGKKTTKVRVISPIIIEI